jgi:hypothetical protein
MRGIGAAGVAPQVRRAPCRRFLGCQPLALARQLGLPDRKPLRCCQLARVRCVRCVRIVRKEAVRAQLFPVSTYGLDLRL